MPTLSLSMIVRNEAATLGHCLASVQGLVDEIVVVDTGSTDDTLVVAASHGARIGHFPWRDDFSAARNAGLELCSGDWVLVLDADEAIDRLDHSRIRAALESPQANAYRLILRNYLPSGSQTTAGIPATPNRSPYIEGRECGHYADFRGLRLCRRIPGLAFRGRIHELLDPCFEAQGMPIRELPAVIHHFGKLLEDREARKRTYYLDLAKQEAARHPQDFQTHFNLLLQALTAEDWVAAEAASRTCLRLRKAVPPMVLLGHAIALQQTARPAEALPFLDRLLAAEPGNAPALVRKAISVATLGGLDEARDLFRKAIRTQPGFLLSYLNLADLERQLGRFHAARQALQEGLAQGPADAALLGALVHLAVQGQDLGQAAADAAFALTRHPSGGSGLWQRLAALGALQRGARAEAAGLLDDGLRRFPQDTELARLRRAV